ncbi:MAG: acyl-CoA dehydrogenase [Acidobacteria bacterium]|nr:acyl-CoA dehydrogenase [Acidobacteriota bacterium]
MDLDLTAQEVAFRDEAREWLAANVPADWAERRRRDEPMEERFAYLRRWQRRCFDAGWAGVHWPREYGGRGATLIERLIVIEEMARVGAPHLPGVIGLEMVGPTIIAFGTEAQKQRYLAKILSGEEIWCQGFSEPNSGSDLASLRADARLDGDHYVVNGQKVWTSYGWAADWCELLVRTDAGAASHKGLTCLLVDMKSPGVTVKPLRQMTGESEFAELFFENVRVPVENAVGQVNDGWRVALGTLMYERATLGAGMQVTFRRQYERLAEIARQTGKSGDAVLRQKLAQSRMEMEVMRLAQMRSVSRIVNGGVPGPEGSLQKILWSELNQRLQQTAMEVLGVYGQLAGGAEAVDGGQWAYAYLRARGNTIEAGTSEIQRNIIGHFVLGLPRSY